MDRAEADVARAATGNAQSKAITRFLISLIRFGPLYQSNAPDAERIGSECNGLNADEMWRDHDDRKVI